MSAQDGDSLSAPSVMDARSVSTGDETLASARNRAATAAAPDKASELSIMNSSLEAEILEELGDRLDRLELEPDVDHVAKADRTAHVITKAAPATASTTPYKRRRVLSANKKVAPVPHMAAESNPKAVKRAAFRAISLKIRLFFIALLRPCGFHQRSAGQDTRTKPDEADTNAPESEEDALVSTAVIDVTPAEEDEKTQTVPDLDDGVVEVVTKSSRELSIHSDVPQFLLPPQHSSDNKKPCLVLDLDETLVCSSFNPVPNADFIIPIDIEGEWHNVYVLKRPHVDSFLKRLGSEFEVVVFTASLSNYANPVLDALDVSGVIRYRLFREHCTYYQGNYVKDLSLLGRSLESTIIIDNSPVAYLFHPANAIPCTSWFEDPADEELSDLVPFLQELKTVPDVRAVLGVEPEDDDEAAMAY